MVRRFVYVKLKPEELTNCDQVAALARQILPTVPGVTGALVAVPADDSSKHAWDVMFQVDFARIEDVEPYRVHPTHQRFVDDLYPRVAVIKAWNFSLSS